MMPPEKGPVRCARVGVRGRRFALTPTSLSDFVRGGRVNQVRSKQVRKGEDVEATQGKFLSLEAAAARHETSVRTLYRLRRQRELTFHRRCGCSRMWIEVEELDRVMRMQAAPLGTAG